MNCQNLDSNLLIMASSVFNPIYIASSVSYVHTLLLIYILVNYSDLCSIQEDKTLNLTPESIHNIVKNLIQTYLWLVVFSNLASSVSYVHTLL